MNIVAPLLVVLATCQGAMGWMFHYPLTAREGQKRLQFEITTADQIGPDPPYIFQVSKNVTGRPNEQVAIQYITPEPDTNSTLFYWDNNQPLDTIIQFVLTDKSSRPVRSPWVTVTADLVLSASYISSISTASAASVAATQTGSDTRNPSATTSGAGAGSPTPTSPPVKTNIGAIAGGVVGGVLALAALSAALLLIFYRRRKTKEAPVGDMVDLGGSGASVTPFVYDNPYQPQATRAQRYDPAFHTASGPYSSVGDAPPIYSPPPTSPHTEASSYAYTSQASGSTYHVASGPRASDRKGNYGPVSTIPN